MIRILLALAFALCALGFSGEAAASCYSTGYVGSYFCSSPQEAKTAADASMTATCSGQTDKGVEAGVLDWGAHGHPNHNAFRGVVENPANWTCGTPSQKLVGAWYMYDTPTCPGGAPFNTTTGECPKDCSAEPTITNKYVRGSQYMCSNECRYEQDDDGGVNVCIGGGTQMYCGAARWKPTGGPCQTGDPAPQTPHDPDKPTCSPVPGNAALECVRPNGDHCVTMADGRSECWTPFETGPKLTADGTLGGDRQVAPTTPTPPANQENPVTQTTTTTTINHNTYNTTITTGSGVTGPGQPNTGVKGDTNGNGKIDDGESGGDGDSDFGNVGAGVGTLYTKSTDTVGSLMSGLYGQITSTPILQGITNFMMVQGGGTCPVFTLPASDYWDSQVLDMHCSGDFYAFLQACGWVLAAMAAYLTVKIAMT